MALSLTPSEAETKITQVDEAMNNLRTLASKILDSTQTMTAGAWLGARAQTFNHIMAQHNDDFNNVINQLTQVAEKGKSDIRTIVGADAS